MPVIWINKNGTLPADGLTPESGWRTFGTHGNQADPGDIVVVVPADYSTENLAPVNSGTLTNRIAFYSAAQYDLIYKDVYPGMPLLKKCNLNMFPFDTYYIVAGFDFTDSVACHINPAEGCDVYGNTFQGGVLLQLCKDMVFESNGIDLGLSGSVFMSYENRGSLTFSHNTVLGPSLSSSAPIINLTVSSFATGVRTPASPYIRVFNNIIKRRLSTQYIWEVGFKENMDFDAFFFIDGNFYDYNPDHMKFSLVGIDSTPSLRVESDTYLEWLAGSTYWVGKDVLGSWGDAQLGRDGNKFDLVWTSPCINVTSRDRLTHDKDYKASWRPALGRFDLGCEEVLPPIEEYNVYGFSSKTYANFNEAGVTTQCVLFVDLEMDFPDAALVKVSFNGGSTWCILLDTFNGIDLTEETYAIAAPDRGTDLRIKAELWIHDSNICEPDTGTPLRVDLEYFSDKHIGAKYPPGTELDIYDSEFNPITRIIAGHKSKFETFLAPGTYNVKASSGSGANGWRQVDVGHGTWFGRYSEQPGDIWHQFHKAKAWTALNGVQWGQFMFWDQFKDETLRMSQGTGCPLQNTGEDYWPSILFVRQGKALKNRSSFNSFFLVTDPTVWTAGP